MTYRFTRAAVEDFENLYAAGVSAFGVDQAERYVAELIEALTFLATFPMAARARPELGSETRSHPFRSHIILYRPDGSDILIQRIRHGREDWVPAST